MSVSRLGSKRRGLVVTMALGAMVLAACGGGTPSASNGGGGGSGGGGTSTTAGGSGGGGGSLSGTVTMSMVGPLTGTYATDGQPILEGAKAATAEINADGGILGKKLKMDIVDTVGDPADAVPAVNKEVAIGHPVAFIGPVTLSIHAIQPIIDSNQIVDGLNAGSTHFDNNTDPWLYRCNASDSELGVAMAALGSQRHYKTAVIFMSSSATSETLRPVIAKAWQAVGGTLLKQIVVTPGLSSYTSQVHDAISLHPDVIFTQMDPGTAAVAYANFKAENNLATPFIGTDLEAGSDFIKAVKPAVAKATTTSVVGSNQLTAAGPLFQQWYKKINGHTPLAGAAYGYDCTIDFALAMTKAHSTSPTTWAKDIINVSNPPGTKVSDYKTGLADLKAGTKINYEGASGPMDFNKYHNVTGAWDVVRASGDAGGDTTTLSTISGTTIQSILNKES
ncbi:MAG: ABC transporter substrate-binding protein [Acidimicrobiales bacterium]